LSAHSPTPRFNAPKTLRVHLIALAVVAMLTLALVYKVRRDPLCAVDEPGWLRSGGVAYQLVTDRAPAEKWETAFGENEFDNRNPPVGKLIIGAMMAANGLHLPNYRWAWGLSYDENLARGTLPPVDVLRSIRLGVTMLGAVTLLLMYSVAWRLTRSAWAIAAPVYLFNLPVFQFVATRVYTDVIEVMLMLVSGLAVLIYVDQPRRWAPLCAAAIAAGLACATKFSAAPLVIALAIVVARASAGRLLPLLIVMLVPVLVFVAVNPFLYRAPVTRTRGVIASWGALISQQQQRVPALAVRSRATALRLVATRTVFPEVFATPLVVRLTASAILLVGVCNLSSPWLIIVVVQVAATVLWLPFDWQPYYLPTLTVLTPAFATGLRAGQQAMSRLMRR